VKEKIADKDIHYLSPVPNPPLVFADARNISSAVDLLASSKKPLVIGEGRVVVCS
jgi:hypothetical protein